MEKRYLQLYSLGASLSQDFKGNLIKVKEMGYTGVEFAGNYYGGMRALDLKKYLAEVGLEPLSTHIMINEVKDQLDYAADLGIKYIIVPMENFSTDQEAEVFAEKLEVIGKETRKKNMKLGYHNHRHEFLSGKDGYLLETLIKNTSTDNVCFELDVGWAACSGVDCPAFIKSHAGRFKLIHVKECNTIAGPEKIMDIHSFEKDRLGNAIIPKEVIEKLAEQKKWNVPNGQGIIDWMAVVAAAREQGTKGFIVEREYNYGKDLFECVKEDCEHLKTL